MANDLRDLHGRGMASASELYKLPLDQQEMDRLSVQHRVWTLMAGGLYPKEAENAIEAVLSRSEQPMILDIGCGSGNWAVEMATKFPNANILGVDLVKSTPKFTPENCCFIKANITTDLEKYAGTFDLVQCRSVAKHVPDASVLTDNIWKILKPGGIFIFADAVTDIYDTDRHLYPLALTDGKKDEIDRSWFARWLFEVTERWTSKARQNTEGDKLHVLLEEHGGYEVLGTKEYFSPLNWDGGDMVNGEEIGKLMLLNIHDFLQSSRPSLLASGLSGDDVDIWTTQVKEEVFVERKKQFMKWVINWAVRR